MWLTRKIQQWEIDAYNPTRPDDDKFTNSDYMCSRNAYDRTILNKLGQLEDIEEELGIDLITLFKALKNGIWSKKGDKVEKIEITDNLHLVLDCNGSTDKTNYWILDYYDMNSNRTESIDNWWIDDYGKTWALTKEELLWLTTVKPELKII